MSTDAHPEIHFGRPMIGDDERAAVLEVMAGPQLVHGPRAKAFEAAFADMLGAGAHATTVSSCTAGLHLAYMHLGVGAGDEVIVPAQTHIATAHAVEITGARPVFVDCERDSGNIDVDAVEAALSERTRAISLVHYLGLPADVERLVALARRRDLFVVEDCATAIGGSVNGTACGLLGDVGVFSFYPVKHLTTAEGGMVVSRHAEVVASIANIKAFGYSVSPNERKIPGVYDVARLGLNMRMNEIAAAIGLAQVPKMTDFGERRAGNAATLRAALAGIDEISVLADGDGSREHANYCLVAVLDGALARRRDDVAAAMRARRIGTSVYYPVPPPLSLYYRERYGHRDGEFPHAARISYGSLALPIGPHLAPDDMRVIANGLKAAIQEVGR